MNTNKFTFVLKDKGTHNQGWWLRIQSMEELLDYLELTYPTQSAKIIQNYLNDKSELAVPNPESESLTQAVVLYGQKNPGFTIYQAIAGFNSMRITHLVKNLEEYGTVYINCVGGSTFKYNDIEYAVVRRSNLVWPDYKEEDIRIKRFEGGDHFYAYIGDVQVKQGTGNDTIIKWDTYDEAYQAALSYINPEE